MAKVSESMTIAFMNFSFQGQGNNGFSEKIEKEQFLWRRAFSTGIERRREAERRFRTWLEIIFDADASFCEKMAGRKRLAHGKEDFCICLRT